MPGPSDVLLIRHASAIDETLELRDPYRHLTALGRQQARALGDRLRWHDCEPTHLWSSPLVRAIQTAELVALTLGSATLIETLPALAPEGHPRDVAAAIAKLPAGALVMLFGHEPTLSAVGALLTNDAEFSAIAKAEAVRIHDGRVRWRFAWNAEAPTPNV
ncbi:MAG TPA: histidine phosphatase family protein [Kofleriaceae bacterium]|nr:histidine phosphatase family protein [Kofleriaceae bacterium]